MTPKKILLAEDDSDDQQFFFEFLEKRSDLVLLPAAENGEAVFEYLGANESTLPDAIILDQNMPRRNGLQTLAMLKEHSEYRHIPVMIYSTYADENLVRRSVDIGAALVMAKPSNAEGYHRMIDTFFKTISANPQ